MRASLYWTVCLLLVCGACSRSGISLSFWSTAPDAGPADSGEAPRNGPPSAVDDSATTDEAVPVDVPVLVNDSDPDGDALSIAAFEQGAHGVVSREAAALRYSPSSGFLGDDSFSYDVEDGRGASATATVRVTVRAPVSAPTANPDIYELQEDLPLDAPAPGVLANDSGPSLQARLVTGPAHGTLALNEDGSFTYVPAANYEGPDGFSYEATNGSASSASTVSLTVNPVDDPPVAVDDSFELSQDTAFTAPSPGVLANDGDPDSTLVAERVVDVAHGTLELTANGGFSYTPSASFFGDDSFTYRAVGGSLSATATVTLHVAKANTAPVAADDSASLAESGVAEVPVLTNDTDPDLDPLTVTAFSQGTLGTVSDQGGGVLRFTASAGCGADGFSYTVSDGRGGTDEGLVSVTVNCAPVAAADQAFTVQNAAKLIEPLRNDTDPEADALTLASFHPTSAQGGTVVSSTEGRLLYTPPDGYLGADSFEYSASDGQGNFSTGVVSVTVEPTPPGPRLWLRADAGVSSSGGVVDTWTEQSGNGWVAAAETSGARPLYVANGGPNGLPYVEFDGLDDHVHFGGNFLYSSNDGMTFMVAVRSFEPRADPVVVAMGYGADNDYILTYDTTKAGTRFPKDGGGAPGQTGVYATSHPHGTNWVVATSTIRFSDVAELWLNGLSFGSASAASTSRITASEIPSFGVCDATAQTNCPGLAQFGAYSTRCNCGGPLTVGLQPKFFNESTRNLCGQLGELLIWDHWLSPGQREDRECYLARRWGLTLDHPCPL